MCVGAECGAGNRGTTQTIAATHPQTKTRQRQDSLPLPRSPSLAKGSSGASADGIRPGTRQADATPLSCTPSHESEAGARPRARRRDRPARVCAGCVGEAIVSSSIPRVSLRRCVRSALRPAEGAGAAGVDSGRAKRRRAGGRVGQRTQQSGARWRCRRAS